MWKIDWSNPKCKISKYFTVGEATYLPKFDCYHNPSEAEKGAIIHLAVKLDIIRDLFGLPFIVHCWIRPTRVNSPGSKYHMKNYNLAVGSTSEKSAHITGEGLDGHIETIKCADARAVIIRHLEDLGLRMEDIDGEWIHLDTKPVGINRFFKP